MEYLPLTLTEKQIDFLKVLSEGQLATMSILEAADRFDPDENMRLLETGYIKWNFKGHLELTERGESALEKLNAVS